jgi:predicted nicotinamide N-methyase
VTYTFPNDPSDNGPADERTVTILESRAVLASSGTTGLRTWESALHLGKYLATNAGIEKVRGKNILELGGGTGLLSILCAKHLGAARVTATDGDEVIVNSLKSNVFINGVDAGASVTSVECAALKWGWPLDAMTFEEDYALGRLDVVLGADVVRRSPHPSFETTTRLRKFCRRMTRGCTCRWSPH